MNDHNGSVLKESEPLSVQYTVVCGVVELLGA